MKSLIRALSFASSLAIVPALLAGPVTSSTQSTAGIEIPAQYRDAASWNLAPPSGVVAYQALSVGTIYVPTNAQSPVDGLPYDEYADDCHLTFAGELFGFTIGYYEPSAPSVTATVTFYANSAVDDVLGAPVAGPYVFSNLPGAGINVISLTPPDNPSLPQDVWFAVQFDPPTAGLVNSPLPSPTVGVSHNIFLDTGFTPPPGLVWFGGDPLANFMIEIQLSGATPVQQSSWGKIKHLYR
jgi:hypothetical protein